MPRAAPGGRREVGLPQQHVRLGEARIQHRVVLRVCRRRELRWSPRCRIACRYWDGSTPRPLALRGEAAPTLADSPPNRPEETSLARRGAGACPRLSRPRPCPRKPWTVLHAADLRPFRHARFIFFSKVVNLGCGRSDVNKKEPLTPNTAPARSATASSSRSSAVSSSPRPV